MSSVYEYINLILLLDVNAFVFATERIRSAQPHLQQIFLALGEFDMMQSVTAWRKMLEQWRTPVFIPREQRLEGEEIFDPLLAAPVSNSISVKNVGVLVTDSNMSGKTTFIRTACCGCW